jgi:hypothetical protein
VSDEALHIFLIFVMLVLLVVILATRSQSG